MGGAVENRHRERMHERAGRWNRDFKMEIAGKTLIPTNGHIVSLMMAMMCPSGQAHCDRLDGPTRFHAQDVGRNMPEPLRMAAEVVRVSGHQADDLDGDDMLLWLPRNPNRVLTNAVPSRISQWP
jgi:hypothetical protein